MFRLLLGFVSEKSIRIFQGWLYYLIIKLHAANKVLSASGLFNISPHNIIVNDFFKFFYLS